MKGLFQPGCKIRYPLNLVRPRIGSAVEEDKAVRTIDEYVFGSLQHDLHAEVILPGRIFDIPRRKQCVSDVILAENRT